MRRHAFRKLSVDGGEHGRPRLRLRFVRTHLPERALRKAWQPLDHLSSGQAVEPRAGVRCPVVKFRRLHTAPWVNHTEVCGDQTVCGIVTDRDLVVRALAERVDPQQVALRDICTQQVTTVQPDTSVDEAVKLMRENALRRLPVVDGKRPVGVVSLGDLATTQDPNSALADISSAAPNN